VVKKKIFLRCVRIPLARGPTWASADVDVFADASSTINRILCPRGSLECRYFKDSLEAAHTHTHTTKNFTSHRTISLDTNGYNRPKIRAARALNVPSELQKNLHESATRNELGSKYFDPKFNNRCAVRSLERKHERPSAKLALTRTGTLMFHVWSSYWSLYANIVNTTCHGTPFSDKNVLLLPACIHFQRTNFFCACTCTLNKCRDCSHTILLPAHNKNINQKKKYLRREK
jgi:hypothetical protein